MSSVPSLGGEPTRPIPRRSRQNWFIGESHAIATIGGPPAALAAKAATTTIPIVFTWSETTLPSLVSSPVSLGQPAT